MKYFLKQEGEFLELEINKQNGQLMIEKGKRHYEVDIIPLDTHRFSVIINNRSYLVQATPEKEKKTVRLFLKQQERLIQVFNQQQKMESEILGADEGDDLEGEIRAPMPGMVLKVEVGSGEPVEVGQPLLVIEAMKMENEIRSTMAGTVHEVLVKSGQAVERDDVLMKIGT